MRGRTGACGYLHNPADASIRAPVRGEPLRGKSHALCACATRIINAAAEIALVTGIALTILTKDDTQILTSCATGGKAERPPSNLARRRGLHCPLHCSPPSPPSARAQICRGSDSRLVFYSKHQRGNALTQSRGLGRGGPRHGGGRPKGSKNKRTVLTEVLLKLAAADRELPLYALLRARRRSVARSALC